MRLPNQKSPFMNDQSDAKLLCSVLVVCGSRAMLAETGLSSVDDVVPLRVFRSTHKKHTQNAFISDRHENTTGRKKKRTNKPKRIMF